MEPQEIRRAVLKRLIDEAGESGLAKVAKRTGKPDRQLNDMLAGRKPFGEKVAGSMEVNAILPKGYFSDPKNLPTESEKDSFLSAHNDRYEILHSGLQVREDPAPYGFGWRRFQNLIDDERRDEPTLKELAESLDMMDGEGRPLAATAMILELFARHVETYRKERDQALRELEKVSAENTRIQSSLDKRRNAIDKAAELLQLLFDENPDTEALERSKDELWKALGSVGKIVIKGHQPDRFI